MGHQEILIRRAWSLEGSTLRCLAELGPEQDVKIAIAVSRLNPGSRKLGFGV